MEQILDLVGGVPEKIIEMVGIVIKTENIAIIGQGGIMQQMNIVIVIEID